MMKFIVGKIVKNKIHAYQKILLFVLFRFVTYRNFTSKLHNLKYFLYPSTPFVKVSKK